jgi:hypothetical protein
MVRRRTSVFWRFLREHNIDLAARKFWCESDDPEFKPKAADVVGLYLDHLINRRG